MAPLLGRFNTYRFDYASLVFDSVRAFTSDEYRTGARLLAVPLLVLMLLPPAATLLAGAEPFGNAYFFAVVLIAWPWILEKPAWSLRQLRADPHVGPDTRTSGAFDWLIHIVFCTLAVACIFLVGFAGHDLGPIHANGEVLLGADELLGVLWAVALAGSTDLVRSMVALFLARLNGFPLYGTKSRRQSGD